jgi:sorting and assembly machinery component 37
MFYSLNENWSRLTYPTLANMLPIPQRYYVPARMRESFRPRLEAVQLWNLPGIEQEEEKPHFWKREKLREPTESERKEKFKSVFEREKVSFRIGDHRTRSID